MLTTQMAVLKRFAKRAPVDTIALRRRVAAAVQSQTATTGRPLANRAFAMRLLQTVIAAPPDDFSSMRHFPFWNVVPKSLCPHYSCNTLKNRTNQWTLGGALRMPRKILALACAVVGLHIIEALTLHVHARLLSRKLAANPACGFAAFMAFGASRRGMA